MKFSYSWLQELSNTKLSPQQVADHLTMLGLEVESMTTVKAEFSGVVVGEVLDVQKVEGTDHLKVCQVNTGNEKLQIVCGAPNVQTGQKVPVAQVGAILPGDFKIKKAKLRGVESHGMICSSAELGLSSDASGILVLDAQSQVGSDLKDSLKLSEEVVYELSITPNRPDCLGVQGIARDICVSENKNFVSRQIAQIKVSQNPEYYPIHIIAQDACPRYSARIIRNVQIGPSPDWLIERLAHAGMRSINNIVDITNYVMLETGQPLHAFDLDKLKSGKIIVRNAQDSEEFMTLDGKLHKLSEENLLICDGELPVALAGVMGGENSEVDENTQNVLLESAYFSPVSVRKTAKKLGISTEASKRFERGIDPNGIAHASDAATAMVCEYANGNACSHLLDNYPVMIEKARINFRPKRANLIIGEEIPAKDARIILVNLGCEVSDGDNCFVVQAPTFRPDLTREIDLVEEVARVYGYDKVMPAKVDHIHFRQSQDKSVSLQDSIKQAAVQGGLSEVLTFSFVSEKSALPFIKDSSKLARLLNPLSEEMAVLRPSLFASMLPAIAYNINRKAVDLRFFEFGSTFSAAGSNSIEEKNKFAAVLTGAQSLHSWEYSGRAVSFFDAKGLCEAILEQFGLLPHDVQVSEADVDFYSYAAKLTHEKTEIGHVGKLHPSVLAQFDIEKEVFAFELDFTKLQDRIATASKKYQPISPYPFVERDLAIVVEQSVPASGVMDCIRRAGGKYLTDIQLFDIYTGKQIDADKKSLALSIRFQSPEKTLQDVEIENAINKILKQLQKELKASLRQ